MFFGGFRSIIVDYKITFCNDLAGDKEYEEFMHNIGLRFIRPSLSKRNNELVFEYTIKGGDQKHQMLLNKLIHDPKVVNFESIDPN